MHSERTRRIFLVWVDHSVLGVWDSKAKAKRAVRERAKDSLLEVRYEVTGPYVLQGCAS